MGRGALVDPRSHAGCTGAVRRGCELIVVGGSVREPIGPGATFSP